MSLSNALTNPYFCTYLPTSTLTQASNVLLRTCESEDRGVMAKISDFGLSFQARLRVEGTSVRVIEHTDFSAQGGRNVQ